ncbi:MAG: NAD(P)H-dependent oxidoreductase subunit E [Acidimicrobiia bacterium]
MTWSPATVERAEAILALYPNPRSAVMPLLYMAMHEEGRLTDEGMQEVARWTGVSSAQVLAVASFYTMYKQHVGRHLVSVCRSISCHLLDSSAVIDAVADEAGVPAGETAADGSITVESVECIGACGGAPAVQVDYEMVEGMTPDKARALVRWLLDERPETVRSDDLQERFGGARSFDWGPADSAEAVGPFPAYGPYGTVGGSG